MNDVPEFPWEYAVAELSQQIDSTESLRAAVTELALVLWQDSDENKETLIGLIGAIESAKQVLFMHLGDKFNDE